VIDHRAARQFLATAYQSDDWIAVCLKWSETGRVAQRVLPVSVAMSTHVQDWLCRDNQAGAHVFVSVNAIRPRTASRARQAIDAIRHVFLDADHDGAHVIAAIDARRDLPPPSYLLRSSPNRVHVFWRVAGFTTDTVEDLQKHLAGELGTDMAATPCCQTTRLPGCWNHKYVPAAAVTIEYGDVDRVFRPTDFPTPSAIGPPPARVRRSGLPRAPAHVLERARRYLEVLPPAIAGQHGDRQTFRVCCRLVRGFALSDGDALTILREWNTRCEPPWSDRDLTNKVRHARRYGREPIGGLLEMNR
jgi:hypothetical protein